MHLSLITLHFYLLYMCQKPMITLNVRYCCIRVLLERSILFILNQNLSLYSMALIYKPTTKLAYAEADFIAINSKY